MADKIFEKGIVRMMGYGGSGAQPPNRTCTFVFLIANVAFNVAHIFAIVCKKCKIALSFTEKSSDKGEGRWRL